MTIDKKMYIEPTIVQAGSSQYQSNAEIHEIHDYLGQAYWCVYYKII